MSARKRPRKVESLEDFLLLSDTELLERMGNVPLHKIQEERARAVKDLCPEHKTVWQMREEEQKSVQHVSTTLKSLDRCLRGGIPSGKITEFVGPATVGKSQFCFSIAILTAAPERFGGTGRAVIYFDTEGKLSLARVTAIIERRWRCHGSDLENIKAGILENLLIIKPDNSAQLMQSFQELGSKVQASRASLVIIDSIAAILRADFGHSEIIQRQNFVGEQASQLKHIAHTFSIPVLVTNQVTASLGSGSETVVGDSHSVLYDNVIPALGTKWAHCVNTRISLERVRNKRAARIRKSPSCANDVIYYKITDFGIEQDT